MNIKEYYNFFIHPQYYYHYLLLDFPKTPFLLLLPYLQFLDEFPSINSRNLTQRIHYILGQKNLLLLKKLNL